MAIKLMFIHGAWQGKWVWKPITSQLSNENFDLLTIDLPGSGSDNTKLEEVSLESYSKQIVKSAKAFSDKGDIVLVGHSMGGVAITAAASLDPSLFRKIIYICAFLPLNGQSVAQLASESKNHGTIGPIANIYKEEGVLKLVPSSIIGTFFNDYEQDDAHVLSQKFRPQALKPIITPVTLTPHFDKIEKAYIICKNDLAIAPQLQELMASRSNVKQIEYIDSGHEPFFSNTTALTNKLLKLV